MADERATQVELLPRYLSDSFVRLARAGRNAIEVARFGGLETGEEPTEHEVVAATDMFKLRRYQKPGSAPSDAPIVLVPPLMLHADVYDVSPQSSAVGHLLAEGLDPWVVDFGAPEHQEGGLERTMTDHVVALSDVIDLVIEATGRDIHLSGYSQGGMFCYEAAAYRRGAGIASLITYGSPVDMQNQLPPGVDEDFLVEMIDFMADRILPDLNVPAWATRLGFRMLDPVATIRNQLQFIFQLHDRDALLPREGQRRFLMDEGWVAYPGPAIAEMAKQFLVSNRMLSGGFVVDGQPVTLADIECPILAFVGTSDDIAPPGVVRGVAQAAPVAKVYEKKLEGAGHFGLVVGSKAHDHTWPTVAEWTEWIDHGGEQPAEIKRLRSDFEPPQKPLSGLDRALGMATNMTVSLGRAATNSFRASFKGLRDLTVDTAGQFGRLSRIDQVGPQSRISLAALFEEAANDAPDSTAFLFDGRGHTYAAANERIDNVVRGLIRIGVRRGAHVGVLMDTRPSALGVIVALNRLGAVAVILRPDGNLETEVELGRVTRIVADPENAQTATRLKGVAVHVLGGGGGPRDLGSAVDDMEQINPDQVRLPGWYEPNPGRAQDLAFMLFTGSGDRTHVSRITNGRFALSAFGTATSGSLNKADTVLSLTPIHHPSALLTGIGGALTARARLAMTRGFDPETFWDDVRRYGATAVTYTWTMAADMIDAPSRGRDIKHPIRLFIGSGIPTSLWRRVEERFAPAKVLEFYASTEGNAVLVNVSGEKVGSLGRRLPGSAHLAIAKYDVGAGRLVEGRDGFAVECGPGEVGMLLAKLDRREGAYPDRALRAMFEGGDAWLPTGDLFYKDEDGDHWLIGGVTSLIRHAGGATPPIPVQDAIATLDEVRLAVAYGVDDSDGNRVVAAAVSLREGASLDPAALTAAVAELPRADRPAYVRVVDEVPRTTWYRVRTEPLRDEGIPTDGEVYRLDAKTGAYAPLGATKKAVPRKKAAAKKATKKRTTKKRAAKKPGAKRN